MRRTSRTLSDGRELIYFDHDDRPARVAVDQRGLAPISGRSELRYDRLLDSWVVIAPHRQDRTQLPGAEACPFCPSRPGQSTEVPEPDYDVVVFENRFPAFSGTGEPAATFPASPSHPGFGRSEVICFTPHHDSSFADLSVTQARLVLEAWADRTAVLAERPGVVQVFCFENRGEEIGATERHPHGQIYAYPFVTPRSARMLAAVERYRERTGANLFDEIVAMERDQGSRLVRSGAHWTAFVPYAARWPFEVHLYPLRRVPDIPALTAEEREEFCELYLDLLRRFDSLFGTPVPYVSAWHQSPAGSRGHFALHLELFTTRRAADKLKFPAASESMMDVFISDVVPEEATARLRAAG